jgi:hypothetical protein
MIRPAIPLALALAALAEPALAQAVTHIDTELVKGRCRFIADDGEVGHYALKRCPGLAGARVYTESGVTSLKLSFRWGKRKVEVINSGEEANSDALTLARKTADSEAPSFSCANGKAKAVGTATKWTREAIGYDGDPP